MTAAIIQPFKDAGLFWQPPEAVAEVILGILTSQGMNGKAFYVEGGDGYEFEDSLYTTQPQWLGEEPTRRLRANAEAVQKVCSRAPSARPAARLTLLPGRPHTEIDVHPAAHPPALAKILRRRLEDRSASRGSCKLEIAGRFSCLVSPRCVSCARSPSPRGFSSPNMPEELSIVQRTAHHGYQSMLMSPLLGLDLMLLQLPRGEILCGSNVGASF